MNKLEKEMVDVLKKLKNEYAVSGVKAEFEAEGTRTEELMRLKEVSLRAGISLTLKIGGCEAIRDMYDARAIGVDHLVAPMLESPFALKKYLLAIDSVFPWDEQKSIDFLVNIETVSACECFDEMLALKEAKKLDGIVFGRGDLTESLGLPRTAVDQPQIFELTKNALIKAKKHNLTTVIGGGVTIESIPFVNRLPDNVLDRFETRKVCFDAQASKLVSINSGIELSLSFELLWLLNKRNYYKTISEEDQKRIDTLQIRLKK